MSEPESSATDPVALSGHPRRGRATSRLFAFGAAALTGAIAYYGLNSPTEDPLHLYLGLLILVAAALPSLIWAKRGDYRFPVFEVFMLTGVTTYAIPLLSGHEQLRLFNSEDVTKAGFAVLLFQIAANMVYAATVARPKKTRAWTDEVISRGVVNYLEYGMAISTAYAAATVLTDWIPYQLAGVLRAVCFGIGIMATFALSRMWGQGTLPYRRKSTFLVLLAIQVLFSWMQLFLIAGMSQLVLAFLGYITGSRKVPFLAIAASVLVVAVLHTGKTPMREKYWEGGAPMPTASEIPAFFLEWVGHSFEPTVAAKAEQTNRLLERTSLMHILCLVVTYTPERQPFLEGKTYAQIPGQFVPRFFWPGKPVGHISTHTLSIYYGLQTEDATDKTTIAFGLLSEAYANYGFMGAVMLGAVFAFGFKKITGWAARSPLLSYPGLFLIVLMAWSFQSELTLAAWLSSLYQASVAVLGIPFVLRHLLGR